MLLRFLTGFRTRLDRVLSMDLGNSVVIPQTSFFPNMSVTVALWL